jgi:hypothetical protein
MMKRVYWQWFVLVLALCLGVADAIGQTTSATVTGTVTDPNGAAIPSAAVLIENLQTHLQSKVLANSSGFYRVAGLLPGIYSATVTKLGFKSIVQNGIELHGQDQAQINFNLSVGAVSESVTVTSAEPLLQSDSSTVSTVIEERQIADAPLNGRNVMGLAALTPGVVPQGATSGNALNNQSAIGNYTNPAGWNNFQIGGGVAGDNLVYVDGGPLNLPTNNWMGYIPGQDSVQEFRVETNNISSEWGGYYGGVILFSTKSGTNEIHGSAYEYFRNTVLDANSFFNNRTNVKRPPVAQNQYGVSLGGPLKKNKLFLFGNWEGFVNRTGVPYTTVVPSAAETTGDFTADPPIYYFGQKDANGNPVQISCNGVLNKVCPDPTALYMASVYKYWAAPNIPGVPHGGVNYSTNASSGGSSNQAIVRADYSLSSRQQLFARYTYWNTNTLGTNYYHNNMPQPQVLSTTDQGVLGDTITLNSTTVLDVRASYLRFLFTSQPPFMGKINQANFGPAFAAIAGSETWDSVPIPLLSGYGNQYPLSIINVIQYYNYDKYDLTGNFTKTLGRHAIKFGGDFQPNQAYLAGGSGGPNGNFTFIQNSPTTDIFANFMLGQDVQTSSSITTSRNTSSYNLTQGYYINDTYQMSRSLTLTGGVRWDLPGAILEKHDVNTVLLPNVVSPLGMILNPATGSSQTLMGNLALVNSPAYPSRWDDKVHYDLFSPNLGFSYRVLSRTVLRGGFGMSHISYDYFGTVPTPFGSPITQYTTPSTGVLSNPFPQVSGTLPQPLSRNPNFSSLVQGINISGIVAGAKYPYAEQYNLNLQQEVTPNSVFQVGYQGSKGTHLHVSRNLNQLPDSVIAQAEAQYLSLIAAGNTPAQADAATFVNQIVPASANPLAGKLAPASAYNGTITKGQLLKPYPQFATSVSNVSKNDGDSIYHSLQAAYRVRFHAAGSFMAAYTWSKLIGTVDSSTTFLEASGAGSAQDNNNYLVSARSLESFDVPQRLVLNYSLMLPFGRGQHWLSNAGDGLDRVIGGWRASGITAFTHGYPLAITAQPEDISTKFGTGTIRPNRVAGCNPKISGSAVSRLNSWYKTACFVQPPTPFSFGNEGRTDPRLYAQGIDNWDLSFAKETNVTEHVHVNFDAQFLNAFNRVQFGPPTNQVGNPNYGKVTATVNQPRLVQFALRLSF